uniref:Endonuclease/exonuclease/phosphatase domain-containing protein n=1 Tax=Ciona savignyi TaxID=51511 RepID=H2ZIE5_CIOSA
MGIRVGRTASKEQYGFVYKRDKLSKIGEFQFNDTSDAFEREPLIVRFRWSAGIDFTLIPMHAKPSDAVNEMNALIQVYEESTSIYGNDSIILGDLNADCSYVCQSCWSGVQLRSESAFHWLIADDVDTTVSNSNCAYDRLIVTGDLLSKVCCADVFRFDTHFNLTQDEALAVSDHFPVELKLISDPVITTQATASPQTTSDTSPATSSSYVTSNASPTSLLSYVTSYTTSETSSSYTSSTISSSTYGTSPIDQTQTVTEGNGSWKP